MKIGLIAATAALGAVVGGVMAAVSAPQQAELITPAVAPTGSAVATTAPAVAASGATVTSVASAGAQIAASPRLRLAAASSSSIAVSTAAPPSGRQRLSLDYGWRFHLGDIPFPKPSTHDMTYSNAKAGQATGAAAPEYDDSSWRLLDLPHDWAIEGPFDPNANVSQGYRPRGIGWYRRKLRLDPADQGRHLELQFDGIATYATVWFNGSLVQRSFSGYTASNIDITPYAKFGDDLNTIVVRVDAEAMEGWWYEGAGIYRHTWLVIRSPVHIATDGVYAHPRRQSDGSWVLPVEATLNNSGKEAAAVEVSVELIDPQGKRVTSARTQARVEPLADSVARLSIPVSSPHLWSLEDPALYKVHTAVTEAHGGSPLDEVTTTAGFRYTRFDPDHGFFLNDKHVEIQGVCLHQDHAGVGVAVPDSLWEFRLRRIKDFGANALRCSHNAPAPELLDAADRLGVLVMDENRNFNVSPEYMRQLEWLVRRDRNHPSVILWSVFNEEPMQSTPMGYEMVRRMSAAVKRLDDTRPVTAAMNGGMLTPLNVSHAVDVVGFNYHTENYDLYHAKFPTKPTMSSEDTSAFETRGEYQTDRSRHIIAAYDEEAAPWGNTHHAAWQAIAERPFLAGGFAWTGFDYHGEPTPFEWPSAGSFFGAVDLCGFPKTGYYVRQAMWIHDRPILQIVPHWNWSGREGQPIRVKVVTNAPVVELRLNGKTISEQKVDPYNMVSWQVPYAPGRLEAIAKKDGKVIAHSAVETTGAPVRLQLLPDRAALAGDGWDAEPITVQAVDAKGRWVPTANMPVDFEIEGGRIIGLGNGDPNSHDPEKGNRRSLFNGYAQVIVQTLPGSHTPLLLRASASGLQAASTSIRVDAVAPRAAVPPVDSAADSPRAGGTYEKTSDGIVVTPADSVAKRVRLVVISPKIIRVTAFPTDDMKLPASLMAVRGADPNAHFEVREQGRTVILSTGEVTAEVSLASGRVSFKDRDGKTLVNEVERGESFKPVQVQGASFYEIRQRFQSPFDEALYGLGQHQGGLVNYKGKDVELAQHNMDIAVPFVVSSRNYGILWDNNSITRFGDPREWEPLSRGLKLYDANGKEGGLTARYYVDGKLVLERTEKDLDYQYNESKTNFPPGLEKATKLRVVWDGKIEAPVEGVHKFTLYASDYNRLFIDGQPVIDAWRQNWNPWFRDFEVRMTPGQPRALKIEWDREGGYLALLHRSPLPAGEERSLSLFSEVARAIDYYLIAGSNTDEVIGGYRLVTGKATLLPRWAYGFWQSRDHYEKQDELLGVVREYRKRGIPLDNIVQDWRYWKDDSWGSHEFDPARYPNPRAMVDEVHSLHANMMISVWAKFYPTTDNYKELDAKGHIYHRNIEVGEKDWVGPGYLSSFYDPYAEEARQIYWRQINQRLNSLGIDAWWLDSDEPDIQSNISIPERKLRMGPTAQGPGAEFFNSYPLVHTGGVYQGARAANGDKRVFILSRSGFAGLQRNSAAVWSGDVAPRWSDLKAQIAAGIGAGFSGLPNWTTDIGGYQPESRYLKPKEADLREWRELNTRWFEFAAFNPLFRSHGQQPYREIFNLAPTGSEMYDTLVSYDRLRYRLIPYIYTLAADTYHRDYTIMRGLVMDFPRDPRARDVADEYMFGPAFLVNPVYEYGARERSAYLPAGTGWYDFYTNKLVTGGQTVKVQAPLGRIPVFVKQGSILPVGPEIQYTGEKPDAPITVLVYTGRDGSFSLYEDEGTNYNYERGAFSRIAFSYDEATGRLVIGHRSGEFPGMPRTRIINVRWISAGSAPATEFDAKPDQTVQYNGDEVVVLRRH